MDGRAAIDFNREALKRILAGLLAMAGFAAAALPSPLVGEGVALAGSGSDRREKATDEGYSQSANPTTLPRRLYFAVLQLLRPAEAAARRLVIVLAQALPIPAYQPRPRKPKPRSIYVKNGTGTGIVLPPGFVAPPGCILSSLPGQPKAPPPLTPPLKGEGVASASEFPSPLRGGVRGGGHKARPLTFQLLDPPRKPFRRRRPPAVCAPRISYAGFGATLSPVIVRQPPSPDDRIDTTRLGQRFAALAAALGDLPKQAQRLARWRARNDYWRARGKIRRTTPLRWGRPPGGRLSIYDPSAPSGHRIREIDHVLAHCHDLALFALERRDTS